MSKRIRRSIQLVVILLFIFVGLGIMSLSATSSPGSAADAATVSGIVKDTTGAPVEKATVVLLDAFQVGNAPATMDEPLDDLQASSPYRATTAADGSFTINGASGLYFVYVIPSSPDHLPGGRLADGTGVRVSVPIRGGTNDLGEIVITQAPSDSAKFMGTTLCLICHRDQKTFTNTLHALPFRAPGVFSRNQDKQGLNVDRALTYFPDGNPNDNTGANDGFGYKLETILAKYNILLGLEPTATTPTRKYFAVFKAKDGSTTSGKYYVVFTQGGNGQYKQRFVTRTFNGAFANPGQGSYFILPIQFDEAVQEGLGVNPWTGYNASNWTDSSGNILGEPAKNKSFDNNCAGCHFNGTKLTRDAAGYFHAGAVPTRDGPFDYDGDGKAEDVMIGCEQCHGPGSEHINAVLMELGGGAKIINPAYLSAERANVVCGRCHTRGEGHGTIGGDKTEYPSSGTDANLSFPMPGISRSEYLKFHDEIPSNSSSYWRDPAGAVMGSKAHHQQYLDSLNSKHSKNPFELISCDDCHSSHNNQNGYLLRMKASDNSLCLYCHAPFAPLNLPMSYTPDQEAQAVQLHMLDAAYMPAPYDPTNATGLVPFDRLGVPSTTTSFIRDLGGSGRCTSCHMPKVAKSSGRWLREGGTTGSFIWSDISSHRFDIVSPGLSLKLKRAGTDVIPNSCGLCHNALTGIRPDYAP